MNQLQQQVADFVARNNLVTDTSSGLLDLTSELGELAKAYLTATDYGKAVFEPTEAWREEIGDIFYSLVCVANETQIDLGDALEFALSKYERRLKSHGSPSSRNHFT